MIEQLLVMPKAMAPPKPKTNVIFLDMATAKETVTGYPVTLYRGAASDNVNLINGKPSLTLPVAGGGGSTLIMNTNAPLVNLGYDWTCEWTTNYLEMPTNWTNEIYFSDATLYKGITIRWGDAGYGGRLMFSDNNNSGLARSECRVNIAPGDVHLKLVKWAVSCDTGGRIRFYMNGTRLPVYPGTSDPNPVSAYQGGPSSNYDNLNIMYLGALNANANNVARRTSNLRISRPAITGNTYIPEPF